MKDSSCHNHIKNYGFFDHSLFCATFYSTNQSFIIIFAPGRNCLLTAPNAIIAFLWKFALPGWCWLFQHCLTIDSKAALNVANWKMQLIQRFDYFLYYYLRICFLSHFLLSLYLILPIYNIFITVIVSYLL